MVVTRAASEGGGTSVPAVKAGLGLPIAEVLPEVLTKVSASPSLVIEAPPGKIPVMDAWGETCRRSVTTPSFLSSGAGKTTCIPLALLEANLIPEGKKVIMLEPRRLAAKNAANQMSRLLGDKVRHPPPPLRPGCPTNAQS